MSKKLENLVKELKNNDFFFVWGRVDCLGEYYLKSFEGRFKNDSKHYYHFSFDDKNNLVKISKIITFSPIKIKIPLGKVSYKTLDQFLREAGRQFHYLYIGQLRGYGY